MINDHINKVLEMPRTVKLFAKIVLDTIAAFCALALATYINEIQFADALTLALSIPVILTSLCMLGVYRNVISHLSKLSAVQVAASCAFGALITEYIASDIRITLTFWIVSIFMLSSWRYIFSLILNAPNADFKERKHVAIYGAGEAGMQAAASLARSKKYKPVCFIDDNPSIQGRVSMDIPIIGHKKLETSLKKKNIETIILAIPSATRSQRNDILTKLEKYKTPVLTLPGLNDILSGAANISELRDIDPLDLLGRDPVPPEPNLIQKCILNKKVLVTGAGGSIGSELCRQIATQQPKALILFEISEFALYEIHRELTQIAPDIDIVAILGSVQDATALNKVFEEHNIETVYHAAAYKHVPIVEENILEAFKNNTLGTLNTAEAAQAHGVETFVLISTDKAVRPSSAMGATKRLAEKLLLSVSATENNKTKFCFVRFGNVLGSSGSVIPLFREQIAKGGPVTITHPDMTRYFMSIPEAAQLVIQAGALSEETDGFTLDMGTPVYITDMAKRLIRLSGMTPISKENGNKGDIEIVYTGLRPGEKLYEELFIDESNTSKTKHPRILKEENNTDLSDFTKIKTEINKSLKYSPKELRAHLMELAK